MSFLCRNNHPDPSRACIPRDILWYHAGNGLAPWAGSGWGTNPHFSNSIVADLTRAEESVCFRKQGSRKQTPGYQELGDSSSPLRPI